jgi:hypothetical protein
VSIALSILLAPLLAAAVVSGVAAIRERDPRHAALLALIGLLAANSVLDPPAAPAAIDRAFELSSMPFLLGLAVNLAAWWLAIAVTRTLHERNRAEDVHWRDMETLRELAETLRQPAHPGALAPDALLAHGCRRFEFETGLLIRIAEGDAEILAACVPPDLDGLAVGPCPELGRTLAVRCTLSDEVVAVDRASAGHWSTHPEHAPFAWEAFLGVRVDEGPDGARILCFASRKPRGNRAVGVERILLRVMASWLARRSEPEASADDVDARKPLVPAQTDARSLDLNKALGQLEARLRRGLAPGRPLAFELDASGPTAGLDPSELERAVASMLLHAAEAGPDDGLVRVRTGRIEPAEPGGVGFATISITAAGPALDADALAALYERSAEPAHESGLRQLPLRRVVRVLRDLGGDLSMESEEGIGTTLTAFVPSRR